MFLTEEIYENMVHGDRGEACLSVWDAWDKEKPAYWYGVPGIRRSCLLGWDTWDKGKDFYL